MVAVECDKLPLMSASDLEVSFEAAFSSIDVFEPKTTLGRRIILRAEQTCGIVLVHVMASYW